MGSSSLHYRQNIVASIRIAGHQIGDVVSHGGNHEVGSHIIACFGSQLMITMLDLNGALQFARAWLAAEHQWVYDQLPAELPGAGTKDAASTGPGLTVRANGVDKIDARYDSTSHTAHIKAGALTLRVMPGMTGPKGAETAGYPFGVLPRLILTWMSTEAVRMQSPELRLGNSLTDFIHRLGLSATGGVRGNITRLNEQMRRLLTSSMYVEDSRDDGTRWGLAGAHFSVAQSHRLWFDGDDRGGRSPLFGSTITLGEEFYQSIIAALVPVDTRALAALAGSPMKMDLLVWLSHRLGYVRKTHLVPWTLLAQQFGAEYTRARDFRADISKALREVLIVYPGANVQITDKGLLLSPSRTAVPRLA